VSGPPEASPQLSIADWWHDLGSAALVGTARRPVPALPGFGPIEVTLDPETRSEDALLTAAALGATAVRAGRPPEKLSPPDPSPADVRPPAGRLAVQLLELVLTHPPAGAQQRNTLVLHWLRSAAMARQRLPHTVLPTLLELATSSRELRGPTVVVLDRRGEWLAAQRPDWSWVPDTLAGVKARPTASIEPDEGQQTAALDPADWARLPSAQRLPTLAAIRARDAAAARELVESTWRTDGARVRAAHLEALQIGLGPEDEALLERALDDRAASVRDIAATLLDALPASARAARMAERLRPLIHAKGRLKRGLEIALPDEPDAEGIRDGLGKPPRRRSARGWWLERITAGAPLEVWTDQTGWDPATIVSRLSEADALSGIRHAVRLRRDPVWAAAVLAHVWDPLLVPALPPGEREAAVIARLSTADAGATALLLGTVPAPWSPEFSLAALARLGAVKSPALAVAQSLPHLFEGLHPQALPALEAWLARVRNDNALATNLRHLLQFHSIKRSITEAFR
jgi:hypothetical protein